MISAKAPNKDDLRWIYLSSKNVGGNIFLNLAWVRIPQNTTSSSAHVAFEFNKGSTACGAGSGGLVQRTAGDMLIVYDFEGGSSSPVLTLRRWVTSGTCEISSNSAPCWGTATNLTASGFAEAKVNTGVSVTDTIGPTTPQTLGDSEFGEAGINLTAAGVFTPGACETFGKAFGVSRSSGNSGTARSSLEREEIGSRLLKIASRVSNLTAAVISIPDENGELSIWRSSGLEGLWRQARFAPEALAARREVLETREHRLLRLRRPDDQRGRHLVSLYLPLLVRDRIVGVLEAYGPEALGEEGSETLISLANQAASALENARLYAELAEHENQLQRLVGKLIMAQEEERRRVAYDVHDGLGQTAAAAHQHLQAFAHHNPPGSAKGQEELDEALGLVREVAGEARRVIHDLRPTVLDDFGLAAAVRLQVQTLRSEGLEVSLEEALGDERLPPEMETTLFRVTQEVLTNVRKHARASTVRVVLDHPGSAVRLQVTDDGRGFEPDEARRSNGPGERVGLSGMRERLSLLGGRFEAYSEPGSGTTVTAEVELPTNREDSDHAG